MKALPRSEPIATIVDSKETSEGEEKLKMLVKRRADGIAILKAAIEEAISKWQKSTATPSDIRVLDVLSNKDIGPVHMNRGSKIKSRSPYF